jgi:excisionase family DNA binding protein
VRSNLKGRNIHPSCIFNGFDTLRHNHRSPWTCFGRFAGSRIDVAWPESRASRPSDFAPGCPLSDHLNPLRHELSHPEVPIGQQRGPQVIHDNRHLIDVPTLAERLGITQRFVRRLVAKDRVPFPKIGKFVRFDPARIDQWLADCRRGECAIAPTLDWCYSSRPAATSGSGRTPVVRVG